MHFRLLDLLVVGLSAVSVAEAALVDAKIAGQNQGNIQQRQDTSKSVADPVVNAASTSSTPATTVETSTPPAPTTTPTTTTPVPDVPTSITTSTPTPTTPTPTDPSSTAVPASSSPTTIPSQSSSLSSETDTAPVILTVTSVYTKTNSDGSKSTVTSQYTSTSTPNLANNGSGSQTSGMTTQTRNTVIGVVVGIGGAIILAGLGLVAWRIWGRKKVQDENDGLMDYGNPAEKSEASGSMSGRTPFQSTLESYHAPGTVNTASNF
ncbi:hypothetical protein B0T22DRAFT_505786, partial [Podospora appendiculata]